MAINFSQAVYLPAYNVFARPVVFTPKQSQPGVLAYTGRGIYRTEPIDVLAENGSIFSDMRTVLDIREEEFDALPIQGDELTVPTYIEMPAAGSFEVIEVKSNGGGETSLSLRRLVESKP